MVAAQRTSLHAPTAGFFAGGVRSSQGHQKSLMRLSQILLWCVSDGVPRRSSYVALIVGTILNLINQGDALFSGGDLNLAKIILTFVVPYCVAAYGAVSYRMRVAPKPERVKT
jgi:hypothetical protein